MIDSTDTKHVCRDEQWVEDARAPIEANEHGEIRCADCGERIVVRFVAEFIPQAWINDNAVEIDHNGPNEWDCTEAFFALPVGYRTTLLDEIAENDMALDNFDILKDDPAAPEWVREHRGPFDIYVRRAEYA